MKKVLIFVVACIAFSNAHAIVPEDGVYIIIGDYGVAPSYIGYPDNIDKNYIFHRYASSNEPASLVIVDGAIIWAHGIIDIDFYPSPVPMPYIPKICSQTHIDLGQIEFTKQVEGNFSISFNTINTDTGTPAIQHGRFFALHGVLTFETPTAGLSTFMVGITGFTDELKAASCIAYNSMYVIKL